ncbi:hypothetical protein AeMF1_004888 [Aphanomyces euteiches]|nr:hypothetical protein AeMF1_004888 [Aphanomyces euteiches]KAH9187992.1 hypothetical protein AeNC1_010032 [Aphanomyces euteiches]
MERHNLLDDITSILDDMKADSLANHLLRDSAMKTHSNRKLDETPGNKSSDGKRASLAAVLELESAKTNEIQQKQLEYEKMKLDAEIQQRALTVKKERQSEKIAKQREFTKQRWQMLKDNIEINLRNLKAQSLRVY